MKKREEKEGNHERWLLTYSDLITLLMIFFVIMYASSNVDSNKYKKMSESFKLTLGGGKNLIGEEEGNPAKPSEYLEGEENSTLSGDSGATEEDKLKELKKNVDEYLKSKNIQENVETVIEERGLVISLKDSIIFESGKADIKQSYKDKLVEIGSILNKINNYIRIEGHTDNVPISNSRFNSNWQLSVIRATNVTELLIKDSRILPKRLASIGYGEYRPVADNSSEEGRAKNRRVDIVILNNKYDEVENNKK